MDLYGHFTAVEVTVHGPVDSTTGMVMNISELVNILQSFVMDVFDHKNLDQDIPAFRHVLNHNHRSLLDNTCCINYTVCILMPLLPTYL